MRYAAFDLLSRGDNLVSWLMALPEEYIQQLRAVFDLCDQSRNGYITVDQLADLSRQHFAGTGQSHEDIVTLLHLLDPGGTGQIKFEEFCENISLFLNEDFALDSSTAETSLPSSEVVDNSSDQVSYTTYNEYDMADQDDLMSQQDETSSRSSPEDADCAIIVVPADSGTGSPVFSQKDMHSMSDGEEKYECYGEQNWDYNDENMSKNSGKNSSTSRKYGQPFQKRNTWLRSSLRRSSSEKKRLSSSAQASQLYRSSSFNSSHRSSSCESDDMIGDISIEDDVNDLNQKVQVLQRQVTALVDNQTSHEEKYNKVKQENVALTARIHTLEEQVREVEIRSEERIQEEQKHLKELMARQDREKTLEMESYSLKVISLEREKHQLTEDVLRLRNLVERLKSEKAQIQDQLSETEYSLSALQEENRKLQELGRKERDEVIEERTANVRVIDDLTKEIQELRQYKADIGPWARSRSISVDLPTRIIEMEETIQQLREENRSLKESNEELQAQLLSSSIQEGRSLLHSGNCNSLAAEFEAMSKDEIMEALKEQREVNAKLKTYIDGMLLNILENNPSILEVKSALYK